MLTKLLILPGAWLLGTEVISHGTQGIIYAAAVAAGLGLLWRETLKPLLAFGRRVHRGIDLLEGLPAFRKEVDKRFDEITARLDEGDKRFDVIADAERYRIKDAVAGDQRMPVDRRSTPPA